MFYPVLNLEYAHQIAALSHNPPASELDNMNLTKNADRKIDQVVEKVTASVTLC